MKIGVKIMPKKEVLDTQGRAVELTLRQNGMSISACQVGKFVIVDLPTDDEVLALSQAKEMAEFVLCNALIETFEVTKL